MTAATITMISTLGSSKLWLARTSATVKFRVPVLRASTRRVSAFAPPTNHPTPTPRMVSSTPAMMPCEPKMWRTLSRLSNKISATIDTRLTFDMRGHKGLALARGYWDGRDSHCGRQQRRRVRFSIGGLGQNWIGGDRTAQGTSVAERGSLGLLRGGEVRGSEARRPAWAVMRTFGSRGRQNTLQIAAIFSADPRV
jgi:hypothetical protein